MIHLLDEKHFVSELNTSNYLPESYIKNSMYRRSDLYSWYADMLIPRVQ